MKKRKYTLLSVLILTCFISPSEALATENGNSKEVTIGEEIGVSSDGASRERIEENIENDTSSTEETSSSNSSGSTNKNTVITYSEADKNRINAVKALAKARKELTSAALKNMGELFGGTQGSFFQLGIANVNDFQMDRINLAVDTFLQSVKDHEVSPWMNKSASYSNAVSLTPHKISVDANVSTLTAQERATIGKSLGASGVVSDVPQKWSPNGSGLLNDYKMIGLQYTPTNSTLFSKFSVGDFSALANNNLSSWMNANGLGKFNSYKTVADFLIKGGLRQSNSWAGMFACYKQYRSNAMNDFVSTAYLREYKVQKVTRGEVSNIDFSSDKRLWTTYKKDGNQWTQVGSPMETNTPQHDFRTSYHEVGDYKIVAKQWGKAKVTDYAYYATCDYIFDIASGSLIQYKESTMDNGKNGTVVLSVKDGVENWYETGDVFYFTANDLGEIETNEGITERIN